jgi:microcystin-dependent protein
VSDYLKALLGKEDLRFDVDGDGSSFSRRTSSGGSQELLKINSSHLPLILATRTLALYNSGALDAEEVDTAITQICASIASVHKFTNETILDGITSKGSGAIITTLERLKLNSILSVGSGRIITDLERSKLAAIASLTNDQIAILNNIESVGSPIGSIIIWPTPTIPTNYFECNGAALSRAQHSDLFGKLGTRYGVGDGTSTFNIPDLRGEFIRGYDHGAGNDLDAANRTDSGGGITGDNVGTKALDTFHDHQHDLDQRTVYQNSGTGSAADLYNNDNNNDTVRTGFSVDGEFKSGLETAPRNVAMVYCIRYQNG